MRSLKFPALFSLAFGAFLVGGEARAGDPGQARALALLLGATTIAAPVVVLLSVRGVRRRWIDLGGRGALAERVALGVLPLAPLALLAQLAGVRLAGLAYFGWFLLWRRLDRFAWARARPGSPHDPVELLRQAWGRGGHPGLRAVEAAYLALALGRGGAASLLGELAELVRATPELPPGLLEWIQAWHRFLVHDPAGARGLLERGRERNLTPTVRLWTQLLLARVEEAEGRPETALELLRAAGRWPVASEDRTELRLQEVRLLERLGRTDEAGECARRALAEAREPWQVGLTALAAAEIDLHAGRLDEADRLARVAAGTVPGVDLRARVRAIRARCLLRARAVGRARYLLMRALRDPISPERAMEIAGLLLTVALAERDGQLANTALWVVQEALHEASPELESQGRLLRLAAHGRGAGEAAGHGRLAPSLPWMEALALAAQRTGDEHLASVLQAMAPGLRFHAYLRQAFPSLLGSA